MLMVEPHEPHIPKSLEGIQQHKIDLEQKKQPRNHATTQPHNQNFELRSKIHIGG